MFNRLTHCTETDVGGIVNLPVPLIHIHNAHHKLHIPGCMDSVRESPIKFRHIKHSSSMEYAPFWSVIYPVPFPKKGYQLILIHFRLNLTACLQKTLVIPDSAFISTRKRFFFRKATVHHIQIPNPLFAQYKLPLSYPPCIICPIFYLYM